ncbi:aldolase/citrate lyase family protein [Trichothermofontia sp.]
MFHRNKFVSNSNTIDLCLITADYKLANLAQIAGIDRIMVDLERLGKSQRQAGQNLFLSDHREQDVQILRELLVDASLMVRINPLHEHSQTEIERILTYGVDVIMLPMFETTFQVQQFVDQVRGRARTSLLLENKTALENLDSILQVPGIDEIHIGLNDLRLSLGLDIIFEILCLGLLDDPSRKIRQAGIRFGFGGVTAPTITHLPINPACIIAEQVRLGSSLALLGRSFRHLFEQHPDIYLLKQAVASIRKCIEYWQQASTDEHSQNRAELQQAVLRWQAELH